MTPVEYTFKNAPRDLTHTILLNDYNMTVKVAGVETVVPYANIVSVRLCKSSPQIFKMVIRYNDQQLLVVSNRFVQNSGETEFRSRMYSTFVRVLHFHLKDKSKAVYKTGGSRQQLRRWAITLVMLSFVFCFVADYMGFNFFNPYLEATLLSAVLLLVLALAYIRQLPKDYSATNIPFTLLPAELS
jgi:hypothetical protein